MRTAKSGETRRAKLAECKASSLISPRSPRFLLRWREPAGLRSAERVRHISSLPRLYCRGRGAVPFVTGNSDPSMRTTYRRRHITRSVIPRILRRRIFQQVPFGRGFSPKRFLELSRLENALRRFNLRFLSTSSNRKARNR